MDTYSSGGELLIKTRKPYTITKQRERWTEEEHNRFLEALKLYGRAWQHIEEHIGTKTAVQIRSHAQKFFSKLEKEAVAKGVPIGQALDIDIPPPRPKRKPSNPYPRKTGAGALNSQVRTKDGHLEMSVSSMGCKQLLNLEKGPHPDKTNADEKPTNTRENHDDNSSVVFTLFQDDHCSSLSSMNKNSLPSLGTVRNSCAFREFIPSEREAANQDGTNESYVTVELRGDQKRDKPDARQKVMDSGENKPLYSECSSHLHDKSVQVKKTSDCNGVLLIDEMQAANNYPRHVPVHVLDGSSTSCTQNPPSDMSFTESIFHRVEAHGHPSVCTNSVTPGTTDHQNNVPRSFTHQMLPTLHPLFPSVHHSQDDYRSFLQTSSSFSSLIVSTLLQNPAAHAAASFAATFLPCTNVEASSDPPTCDQGAFPPRQMTSVPSMEAIAAATVAAAAAWWAAHGLLPLCSPLHTAFTCPPASTTATATGTIQSVDTAQDPVANVEIKENTPKNPPLQDQELVVERSEAVQAHQSASKSPNLLSSDSFQSEETKPDSGSKVDDDEKAAEVDELQDSSKPKIKKQVDRSSCGSNTPSSSDLETNALKKEEGKEDSKEADTNLSAADFSNRRSKSNSDTVDSWKEVSKEGRLAFQALFSRGVLPQSFSPPHDEKSNWHQVGNIKEDRQDTDKKFQDASLLNLKCMHLESSSGHQGLESNVLSKRDNNGEEELLTLGLGHGKLKARRTGFRPYKRCSVEAQETRVMTTSCQGEEKLPKRIRLEGEDST